MATGAARLGAPVITATRVLVVERNLDAGYRLLAFDRSCVQACAPLWRYRYAGALSDPSAANGLAWVGTAGGSVLGLPLECVPNAAGACAYTRRAAAAGKPMNFLPPAVTSRRIYTVAQSYLYSFPTDCAEVCGPAWRSQDPVYGWPSVAGSLVWVTQDPGANKMRVDGFSTVCRPVAGKCRPIASIDASDGQPAGPRGLQRRISVADGMLFVPITAQQNHPAGVKVYPTTCRFESCPSIRRFGNDVPTGPPTIANGVVYMAEQLPVLDGSDPGPWFSSVRAFALAQD